MKRLAPLTFWSQGLEVHHDHYSLRSPGRHAGRQDVGARAYRGETPISERCQIRTAPTQCGRTRDSAARGVIPVHSSLNSLLIILWPAGPSTPRASRSPRHLLREVRRGSAKPFHALHQRALGSIASSSPTSAPGCRTCAAAAGRSSSGGGGAAASRARRHRACILLPPVRRGRLCVSPSRCEGGERRRQLGLDARRGVRIETSELGEQECNVGLVVVDDAPRGTCCRLRRRFGQLELRRHLLRSTGLRVSHQPQVAAVLFALPELLAER